MVPSPARSVNTDVRRKARRNQIIRIFLILVFFPPLLSAIFGWLAAPNFLHPIRRGLSPDLIRQADAAFAHVGAHCEDFTVRAPDGILLHGGKVHAKPQSRNWVLVFHGVADNRIGVLDHSELLLGAGYNVLMMDACAHGARVG